MKNQTAHKLVVAALLLTAFVVPFLLKPSLLGSSTDRAYLGAFVSGSKVQPSSQSPNIQNSQAGLWAQSIGSTETTP